MTALDRAQAHYDAMEPPEPDVCPKCGDELDAEGVCQDEDCTFEACCYPERCWCGDPRV